MHTAIWEPLFSWLILIFCSGFKHMCFQDSVYCSGFPVVKLFFSFSGWLFLKFSFLIRPPFPVRLVSPSILVAVSAFIFSHVSSHWQKMNIIDLGEVLQFFTELFTSRWWTHETIRKILLMIIKMKRYKLENSTKLNFTFCRIEDLLFLIIITTIFQINTWKPLFQWKLFSENILMNILMQICMVLCLFLTFQNFSLIFKELDRLFKEFLPTSFANFSHLSNCNSCCLR